MHQYNHWYLWTVVIIYHVIVSQFIAEVLEYFGFMLTVSWEFAADGSGIARIYVEILAADGYS